MDPEISIPIARRICAHVKAAILTLVHLIRPSVLSITIQIYRGRAREILNQKWNDVKPCRL